MRWEGQEVELGNMTLKKRDDEFFILNFLSVIQGDDTTYDGIPAEELLRDLLSKKSKCSYRVSKLICIFFY